MSSDGTALHSSTGLGPVEVAPPPHFTYKKSAGDLQQGDVLAKTEAIRAILQDVHPHYLKPDYTHFIVLTQSCDLVRRDNGNCATRYLTLAAVRPIRLVLERELAQYQKPFAIAAEVCSNKLRFRLEQFVDRLFNNNDHDFFYLHEEPTLGFPDGGVAFLRLSIALRARQHYKSCIDSRILSLTDVFQAKLGWLVGSTYSQVGTEEWIPDHASADEFKKRSDLLIEGLCRWIEDKQLEQAVKTATPELIKLGREALRAHLDSVKTPIKRDQVLDRVSAVMDELKSADPSIQMSSNALEKFKNRLRNDPVFSKLLK